MLQVAKIFKLYYTLISFNLPPSCWDPASGTRNNTPQRNLVCAPAKTKVTAQHWHCYQLYHHGTDCKYGTIRYAEMRPAYARALSAVQLQVRGGQALY